jgi:hypothetical protein
VALPLSTVAQPEPPRVGVVAEARSRPPPFAAKQTEDNGHHIPDRGVGAMVEKASEPVRGVPGDNTTASPLP